MKIKSIKYSDFSKECKFTKGKTAIYHRFACFGVGDEIRSPKYKESYIKCSNGKAKLLPVYSETDTITFGTKNVRIIVKEPTDSEELAGYHMLEDYHYRGKVLHGRRAPLVAVTDDPLLPKVLGYIELTTAFMMNKPRNTLLDSTFADSLSGIQWSEWDKATSGKYTNLIVRIARCVVSPEFRGLGLSRALVSHAISFSKDHWQVGSLKPLFLEITADMLRYVPFVESAGMHFVGETEGNYRRVKKDMNYILSNFDRIQKGEILNGKVGGIIDLQVQYASILRGIMLERGLSKDEIIEMLTDASDLIDDDRWEIIRHILRSPKPTFLIGLNSYSESFILKRKKELHIPRKYPAYCPEQAIKPLTTGISLRNCSLFFESTFIKNESTRKIQQAFGIETNTTRTSLFSGISFDIEPGEIALICGPSGAGKTTLLSIMKQSFVKSDSRLEGLTGNVDVPKDARVKILSPPKNGMPLVSALSKISFERSLYAMNLSGLSEANLYLKQFSELSNGQRYRAMVAGLIASDSNVWIADEFCATLDPITANIVSRNIRRCAKRNGITVLIAAANWSEFIHELKPDKIVHLRAPWDYKIFTWKQFKISLSHSQLL